jgi:sortase A
MRTDVAWLGDTSWPGLGGNTVLAGHVTVRNIGKGPFFGLDKLKAGDTVIVYTEQNVYTYVVREKRAAEPDEMEVTYATGQPQLTLITCTDWDAEARIYKMRLVVFADLQTVEPLDRLAGN